MIAKSFRRTCLTVSVFTAGLTLGAVAVALLLPVQKKSTEVPDDVAAAESETEAVLDDKGNSAESEVKVEYDNSKLNIDTTGDDIALSMYRNLETRPAVEWFYSRITEDKDVSSAILSECDKNGIAPSLAFSLAYAESRYNVKAVNVNLNSTIDRGLFQLNSRTFSKLREADFFDPEVNARHGLAHLKFCMGVAGNTVSALAMYNAGTTKVKSNSTPQTTLSYVGKVMLYRQNIEMLFDSEVLRHYEEDTDGGADSTTHSTGVVAMK